MRLMRIVLAAAFALVSVTGYFLTVRTGSTRVFSACVSSANDVSPLLKWMTGLPVGTPSFSAHTHGHVS